MEKGINERPPPKRELRSSDVAFNFKEHCIICLKGDKYSGKKTMTKLVPVRTFEFQEPVKKICADRKDEWSQQVMLRVRSVIDLHAAEAVYQQQCSVNFTAGYNIPKCFSDSVIVTKKG